MQENIFFSFAFCTLVEKTSGLIFSVPIGACQNGSRVSMMILCKIKEVSSDLYDAHESRFL